eukprot:Mycagemm_TRINITY_DN10298_c1_g4::TRINITY_DN10298_c1_g4_i1::g.4222::m.4222 type:complete len:162 gc:universal TRINITY_DN10298_c1_g4_i1:1496-1011(-)
MRRRTCVSVTSSSSTGGGGAGTLRRSSSFAATSCDSTSERFCRLVSFIALRGTTALVGVHARGMGSAPGRYVKLMNVGRGRRKKAASISQHRYSFSVRMLTIPPGVLVEERQRRTDMVARSRSTASMVPISSTLDISIRGSNAAERAGERAPMSWLALVLL